MKIQPKPIIHGRDHRPDGVDPIPGIGGIMFDTYPQAGNWLYVETDDETGSGGSPSGLGVEVYDASPNGGIMFTSDAGGVRSRISLNEFGGDDIILDPADRVVIQGTAQITGGLIVFGNDADISTNVTAHIEAGSSDHYGVQVDDTDGVTFYSATWGGAFLKVVQVGPTIEYHILSGATWVADL